LHLTLPPDGRRSRSPAYIPHLSLESLKPVSPPPFHTTSLLPDCLTYNAVAEIITRSALLRAEPPWRCATSTGKTGRGKMPTMMKGSPIDEHPTRRITRVRAAGGLQFRQAQLRIGRQLSSLEDLVGDGEIGHSFTAFLSLIHPATRWPALGGSSTSHHELTQGGPQSSEVPLLPSTHGGAGNVWRRPLRHTFWGGDRVHTVAG